jgi:DNA-binding NtrC family response regulator
VSIATTPAQISNSIFFKDKMSDDLATSFKHILVVEDYIDSQEITCELLRLMGHTAEGVANAEDALAYMDNNVVDVLLTDINLPKMSGIELASKAIIKSPSTHIIFASGHVGFDLKTLSYKARLLPKPFDLDALSQALETINQ